MYTCFPDSATALRSHRENRRFLPGVTLPPALEIVTDPGDAFSAADLVLSAVPAQFTRTWWADLKPHYRPSLPICSATKGIENRTLLVSGLSTLFGTLNEPDHTVISVTTRHYRPA